MKVTDCRQQAVGHMNRPKYSEITNASLVLTNRTNRETELLHLTRFETSSSSASRFEVDGLLQLIVTHVRRRDGAKQVLLAGRHFGRSHAHDSNLSE